MKKTYKKKCSICNKDFIAKGWRAKYCGNECRNISYSEIKKRKNISKVCKNCNKKFKTAYSSVEFCGHSCAKLYNDANTGEIKSCLNCDNEYLSKGDFHEFCSPSCARKYGYKNRRERILLVCNICGKQFKRLKYSADREHEKTFCSKACGGKHFSGENNRNFDHSVPENERWMNCEECGLKFRIEKPSEFGVRRYCSRKCAHSGMGKTLTTPHVWANSILRKNRLWYRNEWIAGRYRVDIYLGKSLGIEVMGTYWHGDVRKYKKAKSKLHKSSDKRDRAKKIFLKEKGITILYIWEKDIKENPQMCEKLILEFSRNKGKLENYHSMNYMLNGRKLVLNKKILVQRFEK